MQPYRKIWIDILKRYSSIHEKKKLSIYWPQKYLLGLFYLFTKQPVVIFDIHVDQWAFSYEYSLDCTCIFVLVP